MDFIASSFAVHAGSREAQLNSPAPSNAGSKVEVKTIAINKNNPNNIGTNKVLPDQIAAPPNLLYLISIKK